MTKTPITYWLLILALIGLVLWFGFSLFGVHWQAIQDLAIPLFVAGVMLIVIFIVPKK